MKAFRYKRFKADDGAVIRYVDTYQSNPKTVLFLHGLAGRGSEFAEIAKRLAGTHRIVWMDYRGCGKTKLKGSAAQQQTAKDVLALIEHLGLEDVVLAGMSLGAHVLFRYVKEYGQKHLKSVVVMDMSPKLTACEEWKLGYTNGGYTEGMFKAELKEIDEDISKFKGKLFVQYLNFLRPGKPKPKRINWFHKVAGKMMIPKVFVEAYCDMFSQDYREDIGSITLPCALIYGRPGSIYCEDTARFLHERIPNSELFPLQDAVHEKLLTRADEISEIILRYS